MQLYALACAPPSAPCTASACPPPLLASLLCRVVPLVLATEEHAQRLLLAVLADPPSGLGEVQLITGLAVVSTCLNAAYGASKGGACE